MNERPAAALAGEDSEEIAAEFFDGVHARAHPVLLRVRDGALHIDGEGIVRAVPLAEVQWPERTRHGARLLHLADGGSIQCAASVAWDQWSAARGGRRDGLAVRMQQHWPAVVGSLLVVVGILAAAYAWGLPWLAARTVALLPVSVDETIGEAALTSIDARSVVKPTRLTPAQQRAIRETFDAAVARLPAGTVPRYRLEFRSANLGPNAFALPGGPIVLTDELVDCVKGERAIVVGVLGHELGHLRQRHAMRMLVQVGILGAATSALYGDFSSLLALVPTWLGQAAYSRDAEREADAESVRLMRANGISPDAMVRLFDLIEAANAQAGRTSATGPAIALASHPTDDERKAFFVRATRLSAVAR